MDNIEKRPLNKIESSETVDTQDPKRRVFKDFYINVFIVYTIYNHENDRYYIGYSVDGGGRKDTHSVKLEKGTSDVPDLQKDYNDIKKRGLKVEDIIKFDVKKTEFLCGVYSYRHFENIRLEYYNLEQKMISDALAKGHNLYNFSRKKTSNEKARPTTVGKPCVVEGNSYDSIRQASKAINRSESYVEYRLDRPDDFPSYYYGPLEKKKKSGQRIARGVRYKGKLYPSLSSCNDETGIFRDHIIDNCDNIYNTDFQWASKEESSKVATPTPVLVEGKRCESLREAVIYLRSIGIRCTRISVKQKCEDPKYTNYKYLD